MSEQSQSTSQELYSDYKNALDKRNKLVARNGIGGVRRMSAMLTKSSTGYADYYNSTVNGPSKALETSRQDLAANYNDRVQEAVQEAKAAGIELNLPENGLPETVTNVQVIPEQKHQQK